VIIEALGLRVLKGHRALGGLLVQLGLQVEQEHKVLEGLLVVEALQEQLVLQVPQARKVRLEKPVVTEAYLYI
jgi:hypothetical protein